MAFIICPVCKTSNTAISSVCEVCKASLSGIFPEEESGKNTIDVNATKLDSDVQKTTRDSSTTSTTRETASTSYPTTLDDNVYSGGATESKNRREAESIIKLPASLSGRYDVLKDIKSEGAEAHLVLAKEKDGEERAVIKLYRPGFFGPKDSVLSLLGKLDTRHAIKQIEHGCFGEGSTYEVLEYATFGSWAEFLRDQGGKPMSQEELIPFIKQISEALRYFHSLEIEGMVNKAVFVHRDLKPHNILIRSLEPLDVVLADFGISSVFDGASSRLVGTHSRTTIYAAPEAGVGEISPALDWWSLGIMIAEAAGGQHPFKGKTERSVENYMFNHKVVPLDFVTDARLKLLCKGLLAYDHKQRWGIHEVTRWVDGDTTLIPPLEEKPSSLKVHSPYKLPNSESWTLEELSIAMQNEWFEAEKRVARRNDLLKWFSDELKNQNIYNFFLDITDSDYPFKNPKLLLSILIAEIDQSPFLVFNGEKLTYDAFYRFVGENDWKDVYDLMRVAEMIAVQQDQQTWMEQLYKLFINIKDEAFKIDAIMATEIQSVYASMGEANFTHSILQFILPNLLKPDSFEDRGIALDLDSVSKHEENARKILLTKAAQKCHWAKPFIEKSGNLGLAALWLFNSLKDTIIAHGNQRIAQEKALRITLWKSRSKYIVLIVIFLGVLGTTGIITLKNHLAIAKHEKQIKDLVASQIQPLSEQADNTDKEGSSQSSNAIQYSILLQKNIMLFPIVKSQLDNAESQNDSRFILRQHLIDKLWQAGVDDNMFKNSINIKDIRNLHPVYLLASFAKVVGQGNEAKSKLMVYEGWQHESETVSCHVKCQIWGVDVTIWNNMKLDFKSAEYIKNDSGFYRVAPLDVNKTSIPPITNATIFIQSDYKASQKLDLTQEKLRRLFLEFLTNTNTSYDIKKSNKLAIRNGLGFTMCTTFSDFRIDLFSKSQFSTNEIISDLSDNSVKGFIKKRIELSNNADPLGLADLYAETVSIITDKTGAKTESQAAMRSKLIVGFNDWPVMEQRLIGNIQVSDGPEKNTKTAEYEVRFSRSNALYKRRVNGTSKKNITLKLINGRLKIIEEIDSTKTSE